MTELQQAKQSRNRNIRTDFETMTLRDITIEKTLMVLAHRYGLAGGTIWNIIKKYGYYKDKTHETTNKA